MAGVKWAPGRDPEALVSRLNGIGTKFMEQARELLVTETGRGADMIQARILTAVTPTGEARAANGGASGRYETGNMFNEVDSTVIDHSETHIEGQFGWLDPEKYFDYQENGTEAIEPMHALAQAENQVFDEVKAGLVKIMKDISR